jgi:restriction endonuclease S subunit
MKTLVDVATIQIGYQSRQGIPEDPSGEYSLIRAQDFDERGNLVLSPMRFLPIESPDKYLLLQHDILLLARGRNHFAHLIEDQPDNSVAANTFYVLRIANQEKVAAGYLAWWLNQSTAQTYFTKYQGLSTAPFISLSALSRCPIFVPEVGLQKKIAELSALAKREEYLASKLADQRNVLIREICRRAVLAHSN